MRGTINPTRRIALSVLVALAVPLSACSLTESNNQPKSGGKISVVSEDHACDVSTTSAPAGNLVFSIKNAGTKVTEFYLYAADNRRIVSEVENIGPGLSRDLVLRVPAGKYHTACKPGMGGKGIRADFTVNGSSADDASIKGLDQADLARATSHYADYVRAQTAQLVTRTRKFVAAYTKGQDHAARTLFPWARAPWERVETVAESFGDLDPRIDLREADLEPGQRWTGWHRIEKDLWPPASGYRALSPKQRTSYAADLTRNINLLHARVQRLDYPVDQIGNGAKGLLDEVANGKITGEEDIWSHTDLYDFQANVEGARTGYLSLRPLLQVKDPGLSKTIGNRFEELQKVLDTHRTDNDRFVSYDAVSPAQRKQLSDAVNALAGPLSKMTGAITL